MRLSFLLDPRIFNFAIIALYCLNVVRWAVAGRLADTCYWFSALMITLTITFLYEH